MTRYVVLHKWSCFNFSSSTNCPTVSLITASQARRWISTNQCLLSRKEPSVTGTQSALFKVLSVTSSLGTLLQQDEISEAIHQEFLLLYRSVETLLSATVCKLLKHCSSSYYSGLYGWVCLPVKNLIRVSNINSWGSCVHGSSCLDVWVCTLKSLKTKPASWTYRQLI